VGLPNTLLNHLQSVLHAAARRLVTTCSQLWWHVFGIVCHLSSRHLHHFQYSSWNRGQSFFTWLYLAAECVCYSCFLSCYLEVPQNYTFRNCCSFIIIIISRNHICHTGNHSGTPLPVCCRHGGKWLKSIESASNSHNLTKNTLAYLGRRTIILNEVGVVAFNGLPTWLLIAGCAILECSWCVGRECFFWWILIVRRAASWFQAFSTVAAAYKKWPSGPIPCASNGRCRLGYLCTVTIYWESTFGTPGTYSENYFQFAVATVENSGSSLIQPQAIQICWENKSASLGSLRNIISCLLPTWKMVKTGRTCLRQWESMEKWRRRLCIDILHVVKL